MSRLRPRIVASAMAVETTMRKCNSRSRAPLRRTLTVRHLGATCVMSNRSGILLITVALALAMAGLGRWTKSSGPPATLELVFLGYTNKHGTIWTALVLATNASRVPFEIRPLVQARNVVKSKDGFLHVSGFVSPAPVNLPKLLKPGQAAVLEIWLNDFPESWWTEVAAHPVGREAWLRNITARIRTRTVRRWVDRAAPPPQTVWIKLGPVTNAPPWIVRVKSGWRLKRD